MTSWPTWLIVNLFRSYELNAQLTDNAMALPQTVGFKAEEVDKGIWWPCTVKDVSNDFVFVSFDGWNAEWNRRILDPREIRNLKIERYQIVKERNQRML